MHRVVISFPLLAVLVLCSLIFESCGKKPNIIILVADDLGWNDLSFHGSPQIPTPTLDSLANSGVILNNYYVCPICTPSRGALMTGLYPIHTGLQYNVIYGNEPWGLPLDKPILPQYLRKLDYRTHAVGKWHLGQFRKEYTPTYRGFDSHFGYWGGAEDYYDHTHQLGEMWGLDFRDNMEPARGYLGQYSTSVYAEKAVKIIKKHNSSQPLFLYVAFQAVHSANSYDPLQAPPEYIKRFSHIKDQQRRKFAGMVAALDAGVRSITDALESKHFLENSIIVFTTDNGGPAAGFNSNAASNWPLRGVKYTLWEGGVRGISFVWSPMLKKVGRSSMDLMHITDWLPTLYYAAGGNVEDLKDMDGVNMWDTLSLGKPSPRSEVLLNIDPINKAWALRVGSYKIIQGTVFGGKWDGWYGPSGRENDSLADTVHKKTQHLRTKGAELLCNTSIDPTPCFPAKAPCLFNVDEDPCEYYNLADKEPDKLEELLKRLSFYNVTAVPPGAKPADPTSNPKYHNYLWTNWMDYVEKDKASSVPHF